MKCYICGKEIDECWSCANSPWGEPNCSEPVCGRECEEASAFGWIQAVVEIIP